MKGKNNNDNENNIVIIVIAFEIYWFLLCVSFVLRVLYVVLKRLKVFSFEVIFLRFEFKILKLIFVCYVNLEILFYFLNVDFWINIIIFI